MPDSTIRDAGVSIREHSRRERIRYRRRARAIIAMGLVVLVWSVEGLGLSVGQIIRGFPNIVTFIFEDLLPPDFSAWGRFFGPTFETVVMSYAGMVIGVVIAFPLGFVAADNTSPNPFLKAIGRAIGVFLRSIPPIVWGVLVVAAVGLGPFAGTLALAAGSAGMLIKSYADAIEEIDPGQIEAVRATGAKGLQVLSKGVIPQFMPAFISWSLYRFDLNIRSAAVLGLVGAGGVGYVLDTTTSLFQYQQSMVGILMILALLLAVEYLTAWLRKKVI